MGVLPPVIARSVLNRAGVVGDLLSQLSNPHRLAILFMLAGGGELQPHEMARRLGTSQSVTSQHLAKLLTAKMVERRCGAQMKYYRMSTHARAMRIDIFVQRLLDLI